MGTRKQHNLSGPIGCAISDNVVRAVQWQATSTGAREIVGTTASLSQGAQSRQSGLLKALESATFAGAQATASLNPELTSYRCVRLAPMPDDELLLAAHWQVAKETNRDANDFRTATFEIGEIVESGKRRREVMVATVATDDLKSLAETLERAGLTPAAIETRASALARIFRNSNENAEVLVIDLGRDTSLLLTVRNGIPRLIRSISIGRRHIFARATERLGLTASQQDLLWARVDTEESAIESPTNASPLEDFATDGEIRAAHATVARELAHEVVRCVHYLGDVLRDLGEPSAGCVVGGGRWEPVLVEEMRAASGVDFKSLPDTLDPTLLPWLRQLSHGRSFDPWLVPLGLALYEENADQTDCGINRGNLLDPHGSKRKNRRLPISTRLVGTLGATLAVWMVVAFLHVRSLDGSITAAEQSLESLRLKAPELDRLDAEFNSLVAQIQSIESLRNPALITAMLSLLTQVLPESMVLKSVLIDSSTPIADSTTKSVAGGVRHAESSPASYMEVQGVTTDNTALTRMINAMNTAGLRDIRIIESRQANADEQRLQTFRLSIRIPRVDREPLLSASGITSP